MIRPHARLPHPWDRRTDGVEHGGEVDGDDRVPLLRREGVHRSDVLDTGVVDQDLRRAQGRRRALHHRSDGPAVAHIGVVVLDCDVVHRAQVMAAREDLVAVPKAVDHHRGTLFGKPRGNRQADPAGRSGHDRDPAFEPAGGSHRRCRPLARLFGGGAHPHPPLPRSDATKLVRGRGAGQYSFGMKVIAWRYRPRIITDSALDAFPGCRAEYARDKLSPWR